MKKYYKVLGLEEGASKEDIEKNKAEREELEVAWMIIKSHLNMSGVDMPEEKENN